MRVDEPDAAGNLGTVSNPVQPTYYAYDALNNLTTVSQGVQTRAFTYNSLSRLISATNPESGTINYSYDANGNLTSKTDARGVVTSYVYDALNRVTQRSYSTPNGTPGVGVLANYQATPNVSYFYDDVNVPFSKGRLTKVTSSISETRYNAFDNLGRVLSSSQVTDGQTYNFTYTYNLSGALIEQTYPSGRVVKNVLESDGDLSMVQSKKTANSGFFNYAKHFTYAASGAVTSMRLGNGLWESTQFNSRLQPVQIGLGTSVASQNLLKLNYDYGTTANNGNVLSQTITVPTVGANNGFTAVQNYSYDSLNRLKSAVENVTPHGGSAVQSWKQTYSFDRYGNRRFDEPNTTTLPKSCGTPPNQTVCPADVPIVNPTISTSNNRLSSTGWQYDAAGNTTADPQGRTFTYDAENKQKEVRDQYNTVIGQYYFDGDGKRVKKIVPSTGEVTVFVYDASGKSIAEYSTVVESTETAKVAYLTNDHLGSPRINTDRDGNVTSRHDYHPFGEEIYTSQRTTALAYTADTVRKQFTGYERDNETGLDYAKARMFGYSLGRFASPDDFLNDTHVSDPQSWNLYVYARNNPLRWIDPSGKEAVVTVTVDEEKKKGKIVVAATIGIWTKDSRISQADMKRAAEKIQKDIQGAWKGVVNKDGIEYEVSTVVSVRAFKDAAAAEDYGSGNIIEMAKGPIGPGNTDSNAGSGGFFTGYDKGRWNIDSVMSGTTAQHEFGHLLGVDNKPGFTLMNTDPSARHPTMTAEDFDWTFGREVTAQRRQARMTTVVEDRERGSRRREVDTGQPRSSNQTYTFRAPKLKWWWKSQ